MSATIKLPNVLHCEHCRKEVFSRQKIRELNDLGPGDSFTWPEPYTNANALHIIWVHRERVYLCETCRYEVYRAW